MNVLLTSVGRRAYMVKYFKKAVGETGTVHVCNSNQYTPAFQYADKCTVSPLIYDEGYIPFLLDYCRENRIDILISLFDIDLLVLAGHRQQFEETGTKLIVSAPEVISVCNDKWKTYLFLKENGFNTPDTYLTVSDALNALEAGRIRYPLIVKPRFGCGSIAVEKAENEEELAFYFKKGTERVGKTYLKYESAAAEEKMIIQECIAGQEYGADVINDLNGEYQNVIVRKKIAMRSGETDIAEIEDMPVIAAALEKLGKTTGHVANLDCDIFYSDGIPYILEMNARFGGGYPFSHESGCNLPQAIINWADGIPVPKEMLTARTGYTGYKELVVTGN